MKELTKTWVSKGKQCKDFRQKKTETLFSTFEKTSVGRHDPKHISSIAPL